MPEKNQKFVLKAKEQDVQGQTLIETLVAIFILVMGVTAAVGLAIYALNSSSSITKQIIATGLAREGIEAVKNMRDVNWLRDTLATNGCYNYVTAGTGQSPCYINWLGDTNLSIAPFCLNPSKNQGNCNGSGTPTENYNLGFDSTDNNFWSLQVQSANGKNYGLVFNSNPATSGFYAPGGGGGLTCGNGAGRADYCRKVVLTVITTSPYDKDANLPLLQVQSQVWWVDKKCPRSADWPGLGKCSVEIDTNLTNWKDY